MTDILERPLNEITKDLVSDLNVFTSGDQHKLTINDHLTGWPEAFPIPIKKADTFVHGISRFSNTEDNFKFT